LTSTVFDSALFRDMFGTAEMRAVFSDEALVGRYLEAEAALAPARRRGLTSFHRTPPRRSMRPPVPS
jgi:hypothetical protein